METVIPVAKSLFLCDRHVAYRYGKVDLVGVLNTVRAKSGFPHVLDRFCVFAQLLGGEQTALFYFDIRYAKSDKLIYTTEIQELTFPDRTTIVQLAMTIEGCRFRWPGSYTVELFVDSRWVADTRLVLR